MLGSLEAKSAIRPSPPQSPMAENETLDLKRSPRWNQARRLIHEGASPNELAPELLRVLSLTLKRVAKLIPIGRLIEEALSPDGDPRALLPECRDAAEYAQKLIHLARCCQTQADVVMALCQHLVQELFDQERQALPIDAPFSQILGLDHAKTATCQFLHPKLQQVARTYAERLDEHRTPSAYSVARQSQQELLQLSLR